MAETDRRFTPVERALLEFLIDGTWDGVETARAQISRGRHGGEWGPGDPSFHIVVPDTAPRLRVSDGILSVTDRVVLDDLRSVAIGGVMLWVKDGLIGDLEYYRFDDGPATLPTTDLVTPWDDPRSITS